MAVAETNILKQVMLKASEAGMKLFRNNVGLFTTDSGDKVRTGLHKGSHDLIGWTEQEITPEMVGQKVAVFTSIEIKTPKGRVSKEQQNWLEQVRRAGGITGVARSDEDVLPIKHKIPW